MLNVPMDVSTQFNVYKLKWVCTHAYSDHNKARENVISYTYLITDSEEAVDIWFREEFNCHGDIHELLSIELVSEYVSFDIMRYHHVGEERAARGE